MFASALKATREGVASWFSPGGDRHAIRRAAVEEVEPQAQPTPESNRPNPYEAAAHLSATNGAPVHYGPHRRRRTEPERPGRPAARFHPYGGDGVSNGGGGAGTNNHHHHHQGFHTPAPYRGFDGSGGGITADPLGSLFVGRGPATEQAPRAGGSQAAPARVRAGGALAPPRFPTPLSAGPWAVRQRSEGVGVAGLGRQEPRSEGNAREIPWRHLSSRGSGREEATDLTFEESARKQRQLYRASGGSAETVALESPTQQRAPAPSFYMHGPKPITSPGRVTLGGDARREAEAGSDCGADVDADVARARARAGFAEVQRAVAQRINAVTPQAKILAQRARFQSRYHAAAGEAQAAAGIGRSAIRPATAVGTGFGGSLGSGQFKSFDALAGAYTDIPALKAYLERYKMQKAEEAGETSRRPKSAGTLGGRSEKERVSGGLDLDRSAEVRELLRGGPSSFDDAGAQPGMARAGSDAVVTSRTALGRLQAEGLALEVRAMNASSHAPADTAREEDLERQIRELLLTQEELVAKRPSKTAGTKADGRLAELEEELKKPLTSEQLSAVEAAMDVGDDREVLASKTFRVQGMLEMTRKDARKMRKGQWLNDEMVNFTIGIMTEREARAVGEGNQPRVHFFNTFFIKKLFKTSGYNYNAVRRWTTKNKLGYDLLECDRVIIPVHQSNHWVLAVLDLKAKTVRYLDSLLQEDEEVTESLLRWVADEYKNKRDTEVDLGAWETEAPKDIPVQQNGCDCGVFMLKYADYVAVGCPLTFHQRDMEYFRLRIVAEALEQGISEPEF